MALRTNLSAKDRLHKLVDEIDDARAEAMLTLLEGRSLARTGDVSKGPTSEDDPLWGLVGLVGDEYDGPTDVSSNKYKYIAEHPEINTE